MTRTPADTSPRSLARLATTAAAGLLALTLLLGSVLVPASVAAQETESRVAVSAETAALQTSGLVAQLVAVLQEIIAAQEQAREQEQNTAPPVTGESDIVSIIYAAADEYGQPRADMLRVATCESNLIPTAVNASSNASGLFQFLPSTWATTPYADQNIFDPVANAYAAAWMWDNGRRNEWVCQ